MRKLLGGMATSVAALVLATGCSEQSPASSQTASAGQSLPSADEKAQLGDLLEQCGFTCGTVANGDVSISGEASIDAFFSAVVTLESKAAELDASIKLSVDQIAGILGAEVDANVDATIDNIKAKFEADITANLEGGLKIDYEEPKCSVTAKAAVEASAKCDASVKGGEASVECKGECVADVDAMVACEGELKCTGTAPSFACEGTCEGSCELEAGAKCEGECKGTCTVETEAECDGEFHASTEDGASGGGTCSVRAGAKCEGTCSGSCELTGGLECQGKCKGECTYTAPMAECNGQASCTASGNASVKCEGECKGEVTPPEVSAQCEATAKAEAEFSAECTPPRLDVSYELKADLMGDADFQAEFGAKVDAFARAYGELVAKVANLKGIATAAADLPKAAVEAVTGAVPELKANADLKAGFKLGCALAELPEAGKKATAALGKVKGSIETAGKLTAVVGK